jgi:hypothetical protein
MESITQSRYIQRIKDRKKTFTTNMTKHDHGWQKFEGSKSLQMFRQGRVSSHMLFNKVMCMRHEEE